MQRRSGLEELRVQVVLAVCAIERHASAHEMDVKVHNLVHLVDGIRNMGPLYLHAMFNSESMWGKLGQWALNKTHMEASMFNCALDKDVTYSIRQALAKGEEDDNLRGAGSPDNTDGVGTAEGEGTASPWNEAGYFEQDPEVFIGRPGEERQLTEDERRDISKLYRRSGESLLKHACSPMAVASLSAIWIDKVKLQVGSWFLCRPDETGQLWFGEVQSLALDSRSVMEDREAVLVQARWFKAEAQVDKRLQCPVTSVMPTRSSAGAWYLADSIIPWVVVCAVHPLDDGKRVMLSRHWHILRSIRLLT